MSILSETTVSSYGYQITGEIEKYLLYKNETFKTETKTVEGMPDVKWYLKFYANDPSEKGYIGMYLEIDSEKEIRCLVTPKSNYSKCEIFKGRKTIQIQTFSLGTDFDPKYATSKRNKIPFSVNCTFSYTKCELKNIARICNPSEWGKRLQQNSAKDFKILVGSETFAIHKFLIGAESTVFKRMFEDKFKEAQEGKVTITDFKVQVVKAFIDFCYGRDISVGEDSDEINLLYFADKYDCQTLKPQLEKYFASKLSKENISLYVSTSDKAKALQLRQACVQFVWNLIRNGTPLVAEEMDSFEKDFMKDVFAFVPNH